MREQVVMGIDGGGTKVHVVMASLKGEVLGFGAGGAVNPSFTPLPEASRHLETAISTAIEASGARKEEVAAIVCAGPMGTSVCEPALVSVGITTDVIYAGEPEVAMALWPEQPDHALVLGVGTGTFAWARNGRGQEVVVDGYGYPIGDDGSGTDIGIRFLRAVLQALDGRGPGTALVDTFIRHTGLTEVSEIIQAVHGGSLATHQAWAGLVPPLVKTAKAGDAVARAILSDAAHQVTKSARRALERAGLLSLPTTGICIGGIFRAGDPFLAPLAQECRNMIPRLRLMLPLVLPVVGSTALAIRAAYPNDVREALHRLATDRRLRWGLSADDGGEDLAYKFAPECSWATMVLPPENRV